MTTADELIALRRAMHQGFAELGDRLDAISHALTTEGVLLSDISGAVEQISGSVSNAVTELHALADRIEQTGDVAQAAADIRQLANGLDQAVTDVQGQTGTGASPAPAPEG